MALNKFQKQTCIQIRFDVLKVRIYNNEFRSHWVAKTTNNK